MLQGRSLKNHAPKTLHTHWSKCQKIVAKLEIKNIVTLSATSDPEHRGQHHRTGSQAAPTQT